MLVPGGVMEAGERAGPRSTDEGARKFPDVHFAPFGIPHRGICVRFFNTSGPSAAKNTRLCFISELCMRPLPPTSGPSAA